MMQGTPWKIASIHWQSATARPTHITVTLDDLAYLPALEQFAKGEGLRLSTSENGHAHEYWIGYSGDGFGVTQARLHRTLSDAYWKMKGK